jgi:hypothetical protein
VRARIAFAALLISSSAAIPVWAFDVPKVKIDKSPIKVDVTEVSIGSMRFDPRINEGENPADGGWGQWLNRLNVQINWKKWTLGMRLDSVAYWNRPSDAPPGFGAMDCATNPMVRNACQRNFTDYSTRWHDSIYPAKLWLTYQASGLEITAGDAYVQLGRGMVLSMRKIDDLGIDNTIRGGKIQIQKDPFGLTLVAGLANPSRVDEASGRTLFLPTAADPTKPWQVQSRGPLPQFGSDRIIAAEIQAGRGSPLVLSTQLMHLTRCSPYHYDSKGHITEDLGSLNDFGAGSSCDKNDVDTWLTNPISGIRRSPEVAIVGQSVELPRLGKYGNIYLGGVMMHRHVQDPLQPNPNGNGLYFSYSGTVGPVTNTFEIKSYRNFDPVFGSVDQNSTEYQNIAYTTPPTTEVITQDAMFGTYNSCVDGGRLRTDVRVNKGVLVWGQAIYAHTKSEQSAECNSVGRILTTPGQNENSLQDDVIDATAGIQWDFDKSRSYLYAQAGGRGDWKRDGSPFYRETQTRYTLSKWIGGPFSLEFAGVHRIRWEDGQNIRLGETHTWVEGENYTALKIAPKWVLSQGFEYLTRIGFPTYYVNGSLTYKFSEKSNIKILAGQQRGGLRCVNGVCRIFPAFEGVRAELTLRF